MNVRKLALNPWFQATAAGALALAVYVRTLAPTVMWYDMGEFATAAYVLGVAHNTGYPLLLLLGKLFTLLPFGDIAYRVNLMSAFFAAMTVAFMVLIVYELSKRRLAAFIAALTLTFTSTLWSNATWATSYDLNAFLTLLILWLMLRWRLEYRREYLIAAVLTFGLSLGNHRMILGAGMAMAYLCWRAFRAKEWSPSRRQAIGLGPIFLLGFAVHLYLPLRAAQNPPVNWGDPSNLENLLRMLTTGSARAIVNPFDSLSVAQSALSVLTQFPVYEFTVPGLLLAGLGAWVLWRSDRHFSGATLIVVGFASVLVSIYGIHNIFNYLQPIYLMLAIWLGLGVHQLLIWIGDPVDQRMGHRLQSLTRGRRTFLATAVLLGLPLILFSRNFNLLDRSGHLDASDFADFVLSEVEPGSVVLSDFWTGTPLLYAQVVEGKGLGVQLSSELSQPTLDQQALVENLLGLDVPVYVTIGIENTPRLKLDPANLQLIAPYVAHYYPTYVLPYPNFKDVLVPMGMVYRAISKPPDLAVAAVPAHAATERAFGNDLMLHGFSIQPGALRAGDAFTAEYYWRVSGKTENDYWVDVQFADENGVVETQLGLPLWLHSHWIGGKAFTTSNWPGDQIMRESYRGLVPRSVRPGTYYVTVNVYTDSQRGHRVGEPSVVLGTVEVTP